MVRIVIIGWYGTETIGDRAILAGLFRIIFSVYKDFEIKLGSLYIPLTERTLIEDGEFYARCNGSSPVKISLFNSLNSKHLRKAIDWCDMVVVGGGPLMDMTVMYMLEYSFKYALKKNKIRALLGCGWGPLKTDEYISCATRIILMSNYVIFRDKYSLEQALSFLPNLKNKMFSAIDPAFFACALFMEKECPKDNKENQYVAINFRDVSIYGTSLIKDPSGSSIVFMKLIQEILGGTNMDILLVPMHTYHIGGDDRVFLSRLKRECGNQSRIKVIHNPLSLEDTMKVYHNAEICIGMRFHSIVLQTMVNGRNYIVDYTDPKSGKIINMLQSLDILDAYKIRYMSLVNKDPIFNVKFTLKALHIREEVIRHNIKIYQTVVKKNE